jgi:cellulose synthase/poly-beta-1,6-N-acetylglucosamine synthase-like glycosyltransferase
MVELVSILICTSDRPTSLKKTLQSLEQLTYRTIEVVVVDASSTNETAELINAITSSFCFPIKFTTVKQKNISISRNVGLKLTSGSVVVFLDDDAIPPPDWIEQLLSIYLRYGDRCAGVGGAVRDMTRPDYHLQFRCGITNVISSTISVRSLDAPDYNQPQGFWYNGLMGANSSYRKEALERINGFDEFFEYFLDETDLCLRLIQAGYEVHHSDVTVEHYIQPNHNRKDQRHLTCWYSLAKNTTYFALKHGFKRINFLSLVTRLSLLLTRRCFLRIIRLKFTHNVPSSILLNYIEQSIGGIQVGWVAGLSLHKPNFSKET